MRRILLPVAAVACLLAQSSDKKASLPLKTERKIEFITDEGTWLSVDVSKDGKTILFDLLGDLYTVPIGGGDAKVIDAGLGFDGQAVYSPDGSLIAFTSDRSGSDNLWIAKAEVPRNGVESTVTSEQLAANLDPKGKK